MNRFIWIRRWLLFLRSILRLILESLGRLIGRITSGDAFWWVAAITAVLAIGAFLSWRFWDELGGDEESLSTTVRNLGLVIGGVVATLLAVWRSRVAERQASAAQQQVDAAQRQANTAQQNLLNERYQQGAEMIGSEVLAVRLGGIYALQRLVKEHPEQYHVQIMRLLCAFVCNPTPVGDGEAGLPNHETGEVAQTRRTSGGVRLREDVGAVMEAIATRSKLGIGLERDARFRLDFRHANLSGLDLFNVEGVNLSWARLTDADLSHVKLRPSADLSWVRESYQANLSKARLNGVNFEAANLWEAKFLGSLLINANLHIADLRYADLSNATLANADLSGAELRDARLSGTKFSLEEYPPVRGLSQAQLDKARADPDNPPKLNDVLDAETGKQLIWRGKPLKVGRDD